MGLRSKVLIVVAPVTIFILCFIIDVVLMRVGAHRHAGTLGAAAFHALLMTGLSLPLIYLWFRSVARLFHARNELSTRSARQEVLDRLLAVSARGGGAEEVLKKALDVITSVPWLPFRPQGGVWVMDERVPGRLALAASRELPPGVLTTCSSIPVGECLCGKVALTGKTTHLAGVDETHCIRYPGITPHGHYCVSLRREGRVLGVLNLFLEEGHEAKEEEIEFLRPVSGIFADVIERKLMENHIERRLNVERALAEVSSIFASGAETDFGRVLGVMARSVSAARASVVIASGRDEAMEAGAWCFPDCHGALEMADRERFGWWYARIEADGAVAVSDVDSLPPRAAEERGLLAEMGVTAVAAVPVAGREGEVAGFLALEDIAGPRAWSPEELKLLKVVSAMITVQMEQRRARETINRMAYYDPLTGLPNRRLFFDRLGQIISRGRWKRRFAAVLFIDVDRFKTINDTLGHAAGDKLLKALAARLRGCLHEGDTVARLGGDEFTVILQELGRPEDVFSVIRKITSALERPVDLGGQEVIVTASIGVSVYPHDGEEPDELLKNADVAMYKAKTEGRNTYCIYSPEMNERAVEKLRLENMLRRAVERREFVLHYQPQVDARTGRVAALEALVRWDNPRMGLVPPGDFIPLAEETGLITDIGRWVLRTACAEARSLMDQGHRDLRMAVNISSRQFRQSGFVTEVERALAETGFPPRLLELELTESIIMDSTELVISRMKELKKMGIRFTVDDFGTGYSSLSYLKRIPLDALKIDRSFVANILTSVDDASISIAIVRLAHNMRLQVVAEGVETEAQERFLARLDCDLMQGFLYSRPMNALEVVEYLKGGSVKKGGPPRKTGGGKAG